MRDTKRVMPQTPSSGMRLEYTRLSDVLSWPRNPKRHDVAGIQRSIAQLGFNDPLAVDERTGQLIEGHGRVEALQAMSAEGKDPPERVKVDKATGEWMVPVVRGVRFRSDAEAQQYLLAHNRLVENGGWDEALQAAMIASVEASSLSMEGLGWTDDDLELMRTMANLGEVNPEVRDGKTAEENWEAYESNEIKQVVLYFAHDEFEEVIGRLKAQMELRGLRSNTEVFMAGLAALEQEDLSS